MRKTKSVAQPAKAIKNTPFEEVLMLLKSHIETSKAIMLDYIADTSMVDEVSWSLNTLVEAVEAISSEQKEPDFDKVLEYLTNIDPRNIDSEKLFEFISLNEIDCEKVALELTSDILDNYAQTCDCCMVVIKNMNDREKLREFLHTEIYTAYNDQREFITI